MLPGELEKWLVELGEPKYRAQQVFSWLHKQGADDVAQMTNLPQRLKKIIAPHLQFGTVEAAHTSKDGSEKLLIRWADGALVETVILPQNKRLTICLSTQVGCAGLRLLCNWAERFYKTAFCRRDRRTGAPGREKSRKKCNQSRFHGHGRAFGKLRKHDPLYKDPKSSTGPEHRHAADHHFNLRPCASDQAPWPIEIAACAGSVPSRCNRFSAQQADADKR